MTDQEITDLWCEISQEVGPQTSISITLLLEGMIIRAEERVRGERD